MLLTIDAGNTNIVLGLFDGTELKGTWRMETSLGRTSDEYGAIIRQFLRIDGFFFDCVDDVIISSVVPSLSFTIAHFCEKCFKLKPLFVSSELKLGLSIEYDDPKALGADRIVNAVAAHELYGGDNIVIDFGTANTYCAVTADGRYLGGVIQPGMKISSDALFEKTSKLPKTEIAKPASVIGKNTVSCMQSGILLGSIGSCEYLVRKMKEEMGGRPRVIATGGLASIVYENTDCIDVIDKILTLKGLQLISQMNRAK